MGSQAGIVQKFRANFNSFQEIWLFVHIFCSLLVLPVMIRLFSISSLMTIITPRRLNRRQNREVEKLKAKAVKFTDYLLGWHPPGCKNTCLKRTVVLYYFLRKWGMDVQVCLGVRYAAHKEFDAHAWLLYHGDIFLERNSGMTRTYQITYCFPDKMEQN